MPPAEVHVDAALVRALLAAQAPRWAQLPLADVARGWDNAVYRLGDGLAVRLPLRSVAAPLIDHEARWLPILAPRLPVATPAPVLLGEPAAGYPWRWTVVPWIEGRVMADVPVADRTRYAAALAQALVALHRPASAQAPGNPYRGVPLAQRARTVGLGWAALARRHGHGLVEPLVDAWERGLAAAPWAGPALWLHGDPHPLNVLVAGDRLAGLIDFGDVTAGDPASDLATAWLTFDAVGRGVFVAAVGAAGVVDPATWVRSGAWAAAIAAALLSDHGPGDPLFEVARHTSVQLAGG
jgi:aminoglycoside phosphotransferase (APT) family kinase protein